jgi:hypothetical protein
MGSEHRDKGVDVQLGPVGKYLPTESTLPPRKSACQVGEHFQRPQDFIAKTNALTLRIAGPIGRVPEGGRNWEGTSDIVCSDCP